MVSQDYSRRATDDSGYWKRLQDSEEREIQGIKQRLKKFHGGVFDEYLGPADLVGKANVLRRHLEEHRVVYQAARDHRAPTKQELDEALRRLGPAIQRARWAAAVSDIGGWKKTLEGEYVGLHGRALIHKGEGRDAKKWFLTLDGKDHEIKSRKPSFDHAEKILRQELRLAAYDYDRTLSQYRC